MSERLSAEETAARLGVKKETVYAYVSRGILSRKKAVDGRASTFDADEVDRLRRKRVGGHPGRLEAPVTTAVADIRDGVVEYRGNPLTQLVESGMTFEQTAALLWGVPNDRPWEAPKSVRTAVASIVQALPAEATLIDQLLASAVVAATHDPFRNDRQATSAATSMRHLIAAAVEALPELKTSRPNAQASIAERLWPRLTVAARTNAWVLDRTLMLMADHGMASSTLAARIAASTRAGAHSAVIAGLGALNGPLHGAASASVHELLIDAEELGTEAAIAKVLKTNGKVPGIGHFVHRTSDPRFTLMMDAIKSSTLSPKRIELVEELLELTTERISAPHNIDFALGSLTFVAQMTPDAGELIFAIARIVGWVAHTLEEYEQAPLRFRPIGQYNPLRPRPAPAEPI